MKRSINLLKKSLVLSAILVSFSSLAFATDNIMNGATDTKPMQMGKGMQGQMNNKMMARQQAGCAVKAWELKRDMRTLWGYHILYTRNYIISALADLGDKDAVANRLLKNQDDIGKAINPFYGNGNGEKLAGLLRDHIVIATEVVKAAKMGNKDELNKAQEKWHDNADAIATFLSGANPNWAKGELVNMLYKHLDLTTGEVVSRLNKNWVGDISYYDRGHEHMMMFADMLSHGIIKQFPDKFNK